MSKCKNCGENVSGIFCSNCGAKQEDNEVEKFCSRCGKENTDNHLVCSNCGLSLRKTKITKETLENDELKPSGMNVQVVSDFMKNKQSILYLNIGIVIVIVLLLLNVPIFQATLESKSDIESYNKWHNNDVPVEMTLYELTEYSYQAVTEIMEYMSEYDELPDGVAGVMAWLIGLLLVVLIYVIVIACYVYSLFKKPIDRTSVVNNANAFCVFTILTVAVCMGIVFFYLNPEMDKISAEYQMHMISFAVIALAIVKMKITVPKLNELFYHELKR